MRAKSVCRLYGVEAYTCSGVSSAWADKLVCISNENLKGEMTVNNCLVKGEKFAIVDQYGGVRLIEPGREPP